MSLMHLLLALLMAWTALGMNYEDVDLPKKIPTPTGPATPPGDRDLEGVTPRELAEKIADELQDLTIEQLRDRTGDGPVGTALRDYEP